MKNNFDNHEPVAARILLAAYMAWANGSELRASRTRNKNFTYGRQWNDYTTDIDGNPITEYRKLKEQGKEPITNNMMRQMVKSIIGHFRRNLKESSQNSNIPDDIMNYNCLNELSHTQLITHPSALVLSVFINTHEPSLFIPADSGFSPLYTWPTMGEFISGLR